MPGRPRPAPGGVNAALGVTTRRARRRGALRARWGGGRRARRRAGAERGPPSPRAEMVPPSGGRRGRAGRPRGAAGASGDLRPSGPAAREFDHLWVTLALLRGGGVRQPSAGRSIRSCRDLRDAPFVKRNSRALSGARRSAIPKCLLAGLPSLRRLCYSRSLPSCFAGATLSRAGAVHFISGANTNFRRTEPFGGKQCHLA